MLFPTPNQQRQSTEGNSSLVVGETINSNGKVTRYGGHTCAGEAATGISREDYIENVANDILGKLPTDFDIDKTRKKFGSSISPTSVVLLQELERFNKLLGRMRKSLVTLRKVCLSLNNNNNNNNKQTFQTRQITKVCREGARSNVPN